MHASFNPSPKVALVTGSGRRRVGNCILKALAKRGYAAAVHYHDSADDARQTVAELEQTGSRAKAFGADVSRETDVVRMFRQVKDEFGRLDVLVTAAAVWERKPLEDTSAGDVRRQFEINALGTYLCCREAGKMMLAQPDGGTIVTLGDWAVARPYSGYSAYFLSKGAIPALTRALAVELAAKNPRVRVNCILPGPVMLPAHLSDAERAAAIAGTLVKRAGQPDDVANAVLFLVDNAFVTGVCLPVDGGRTIASSEL